MRPIRLVMMLCLVLPLAGCGRSLGKLSDKVSSEVIKLQVALEDAVDGPANTRDAENDMAEREALDETEQSLQGAEEARVADTEALHQEQQKKIEQARANGDLPEPNPAAGRPAEELSSQLRP